MKLLGVNIDHVATIRQARYAQNPEASICEPSVLDAAFAAQRGGADSITIHVREDRRHMQVDDAFEIREKVELPLNFEMANTSQMVDLALEVKPDFACLVPENREEVTTEGGLDVVTHSTSIGRTIERLQKEGIRVSLFIDPDSDQIQESKTLGADMVELHTGAFALADEPSAKEEELGRLIVAGQFGGKLDLQVNAGHGIHLQNLKSLFHVPNLIELNIGHTLISRAVFIGLEAAVAEIKEAMASKPE